jgi:alpha/beta superfamily hydrolase
MVERARATSEALTIPGPSGLLEAILDTPPGAEATQVAVVCHPHPLYGGAMTNKVAHLLAKAFNDAGARALRFNFRGVGRSAGVHGEGVGETDDALAALDWASKQWPHARLWLGGFSFGGAVAIRAAGQRDIKRLVTVAPAVKRVNIVDTARLPPCPWLLVQGDRDELVNVEDIKRWVQEVRPAPELQVLPGVDHFFHGRLNDLRDVVTRWLERTA